MREEALIDGRYRVLREVGAGAMGSVTLALDVYLERHVAIKRMKFAAADEVAATRFQREAAALAAVRHEHVVAVHAFGHEAGAPFFVMEFIPGVDLDRIIDEHKAHAADVPLRRAIAILASIARGLAAVHAHGIVHRDIKPANIVVEERTGRPVLVDFGIAVRGGAIHEIGVVGTPPYMAPEQCDPRAASAPTPLSDQYSLGCTAFELLTGRLPFGEIGTPMVLEMHRLVAPPLVSELRPDLARFDGVVARALAKRPADRHPSAAAFATALEDAFERGDTSGTESLITSVAEGAPSLRVLVVDDDPVFGRIAARAAQIALLSNTIEVRRVRSGEEALDNALRKPPQLVVLDYLMPGLDGIEVLTRLRALPGGGAMRVLVASGSVGPGERWRFSSLGVRDFVAKPVDFTRLAEAITTMAVRELWIPSPEETPTVHGAR